jgi:glycosyltransferase involved in cell wall biosynthesis
MPGFVADTSGLLKQADALIMTSDHEGLPMAVLEALASGVPVFGFDVGGLPEIAERGAPLFLAPAGDVRALAESIMAFFSDRQAMRRVAPPADWSFDIRVCESSYAQLYAQLAAKRRS